MKKYASLVSLALTSMLFLSFAGCSKTEQGGATDHGGTTQHKAGPDKTGVGKPYGARDPSSCPDLTGAAPSAEQAKTSFICNSEDVFGSSLFLIQDVTVQVGRGRPYNASQDAMDMPNIDVTVPVYQIRGSFKQYQCGEASEYMQNIGKNCTLSDNPNADGLCYKTEWGDWVCKMTDAHGKTIAKEVAPPK